MNIYLHNDTIAAIATPLGTGGVGIIRVSGKEAKDVIEKLFRSSSSAKDFSANRIYYGWIYEGDKPVDEVIVLCFKAPHSFTGEDVFEIQSHGGINIVKKILRLCINNGARLAEKGEFSKRAFINGKIDLSKAESILDLIHAKTDIFAQESALNLSGKLSGRISLLRNELVELLSLITAAVDFPEDVEEPEYSLIEDKINHIIREISNVLKGAITSNLMREGAKVAIIGRPNAGKSSLFNALLQTDRAIVTDIAGTTRDIIQESIDIEGIPVTLIDTAGLRELDESKENYIEALGINLTKEALSNADVVLHVKDLTTAEDSDDAFIHHNNIIKVGTKADLITGLKLDNGLIAISSRTNYGLNSLKQAIKNKITGINADNNQNSEFCTNLRQQACLIDCKNHLQYVLNACKNNDPQDLISIDLKSALICLGEITGEVVNDEILDNIFSNFCIGK